MRCTWLPTDPATVDPQQHRLASSHICKCLSSSADYEACVSSIRGCQEIQIEQAAAWPRKLELPEAKELPEDLASGKRRLTTFVRLLGVASSAWFSEPVEGSGSTLLRLVVASEEKASRHVFCFDLECAYVYDSLCRRTRQSALLCWLSSQMRCP